MASVSSIRESASSSFDNTLEPRQDPKDDDPCLALAIGGRISSQHRRPLRGNKCNASTSGVRTGGGESFSKRSEVTVVKAEFLSPADRWKRSCYKRSPILSPEYRKHIRPPASYSPGMLWMAAWLMYGVMELCCIAVLPWIVEPGYEYRAYDARFSALLLVLYAGLGAAAGSTLGVASLGSRQARARGRCSSTTAQHAAIAGVLLLNSLILWRDSIFPPIILVVNLILVIAASLMATGPGICPANPPVLGGLAALRDLTWCPCGWRDGWGWPPPGEPYFTRPMDIRSLDSGVAGRAHRRCGAADLRRVS